MSGIGTVASSSGIATNISTETSILTIPFSSGNSANSSLASPPGVGSVTKNMICTSINITPGAGTTAIVVRCRQGVGVGGPAVGPARTITLAAAATGDNALVFNDLAPNFAQAYTITVAQTAGTAPGTVNTIKAYVEDYT